MPLISRGLQSSQAFQKDLAVFLGASSQVISTISDLGSGDDGFAREMAPRLCELAGVTVDEAHALLSVAGYIYDAVTDQSVPVEDAVAEILQMSIDLEIESADDVGQAMSDLLSYKPDYEKGKDARDRSIATGPHFISFSGDWNIRVHRTREDESVMVSSISVSVIWHDEPGTRHEAYFNMTDDEWLDFVEAVEEISVKRENIQEFLTDPDSEIAS